MITKIKLQKSATVLSANGRQIGSLDRVVVNPASNVLTGIVVRTGALIKHEEKVVPMELIAETADDQILLDEQAGSLESLPPFKEERLFDEYGGVQNSSTSKSTGPVVAGYPAIGAPMVVDPGPQLITRIEQNIPEGTVAMKEGAKVITEDGKNVGSVESVFANPAKEQITHLLIAHGLLTKEFKLIPITWVSTLGENSIHLRVDKSTIEKLAEEPTSAQRS